MKIITAFLSLICLSTVHLPPLQPLKPAFIGLHTNFISFISSSCKRKACSIYSLFSFELQKLEEVFMNMGFPARLIDNSLNLFLDRTICSPKQSTVPKAFFIFLLP